MPTQNYAINSVIPISVYPAGQQASVLVRNNDLVNHVQLATVANGQGFDLGPGSAITWEAGNPLYVAMVLPNTTATITVLDNGGDLFDASAIAAQIQISGAPPIDVPALIVYDSWTSDAFGHNVEDDAGNFIFDVSKYQSLTLTMRDDKILGLTAPIARRVDIEFLSDIGLSPLGTFTAWFGSGTFHNNGIPAVFRVPVLGPNVRVIVYASANTGSYMSVTLNAFFKSVDKPQYFQCEEAWGLSGGSVTGVGADNLAQLIFIGNKSTVAQTTDYPPSKAGNTWFFATCTAVGTTPCEVSIATLGGRIATLIFPVSAVRQTQQVFFNAPNSPLNVFMFAGGVGSLISNLTISIVYVD